MCKDTTRTPDIDNDEQMQRSYHFVSYEKMLYDIAANEYLEYGAYENAMYGTRFDSITELHSNRLMAVLDIEPQVRSLLYGVNEYM